MRNMLFVCATVAGLFAAGCSGTQRRAGNRDVERNPIEAMLKQSGTGPVREGTAVAVLVDASGSMRDRVSDAEGRKRRKIEIAQDCVAGLVRQTGAFAAQHPDREILLAIYEFSDRERGEQLRQVLPMAKPDAAAAEAALGKITASGGTPIGNAMIAARQALVTAGLSRRHMLVITDGENTTGYAPGDVADAIGRLPEEGRAAIYFVAFDVEAERFKTVRDAGGLVLEASNGADLTRTLDFVLTGKILAEKAE